MAGRDARRRPPAAGRWGGAERGVAPTPGCSLVARLWTSATAVGSVETLDQTQRFRDVLVIILARASFPVNVNP